MQPLDRWRNRPAVPIHTPIVVAQTELAQYRQTLQAKASFKSNRSSFHASRRGSFGTEGACHADHAGAWIQAVLTNCVGVRSSNAQAPSFTYAGIASALQGIAMSLGERTGF